MCVHRQLVYAFFYFSVIFWDAANRRRWATPFVCFANYIVGVLSRRHL